MKPKTSRILSLSLLIALVAALIPFSVYAAPGISVSPSSIFNDRSSIIEVAGTELVFDGTSKIFLDGMEVPGTIFVDADTLRVTLPSGLDLGEHIVSVSTAPGVSAVLNVTLPPPPTSSDTFSRPQFVVRTSRINGDIKTGANVTLKVVVENAGLATAYGVQAVYSSADLIPTKTGGVVAVVGSVDFDEEVDISQTFYVSAQIYGAGIIVADLTMTYYDEKGTAYTDKFTLSVPVTAGPIYSGPAVATSTPTSVKSSQLVITGYSSDVDPLQPGEKFKLQLKIQNVGNADARRITMITGGGSSGSSSLTPQPGGVSAGSGDFANFAPVGSSNVQSLGDLKAGGTIDASQNLIVNVSTNPGAYPMKISFSYLNDKNEIVNDEQVITLLVYSLPNVNVSFYRPADPFFAGQPGMLPIQVVNIGKRFVVLGDIKIEAEGGFIENGTSLVGSLEAGGYFTLDSMLTPDQPGPVTLNITIDYVDDFNQPRVIEKKLEVLVEEAFIEEPLPSDPSISGGGGGEMFVEEETTLHKIFRFIKGLFGLDSAWPVWQSPGGEAQPFEETVPIVPGKGG